MIRIYKRFWQVNWAENWQYRANYLMYLAYWVVSPVVYLSVWRAVATAQGSIKGLTANDFVTYYMTMLAVDVLTSDIVIHILAYKIQDGTLASDLLRPVHPMFTSTFMSNLAFKALTLAALIPIWAALYLLLRPDFSAVTVHSLLLATPAILLGFGISFLLGATVTSIAFWTTRVYSLSDLIYMFTLVFSGQFVPFELLPRSIAQVAQVLPFQFMRYFPVQIILDRMGPDAIMRGYALGVLWFVALAVVFVLVWRAGLKRFSAVGA